MKKIPLLFFLLALPGWSATYFVDKTNGLDTNTGLCSCAAWKTIAKVNASSFIAADFVLLKRGEAWTENLLISSSGVTFQDYGTGALPIINGTVRGDDKSNITLQNLNVKGGAYGIYFTSNGSAAVSGLTISHNVIESVGTGAIGISGFSSVPIVGVVISYNSIHDNGRNGVGITNLVNGSLIEYNTIFSNGLTVDSHGISIYGASSTNRPSDTVIQFNDVSLQNRVSIEGAGIQNDNNSHNSIVRFNRSHENKGAGIVSNHSDGHQIYYNLANGNGVGGPSDGGYVQFNSSGVSLLNNTFYGNNNHGIYIYDSESITTTTTIKNNLSAQNLTPSRQIRVFGAASVTGFVSDNNLFFNGTVGSAIGTYLESGTKTLAAWRTASGQDANSRDVNPSFVSGSDFHLTLASLCINSGISVGLTHDYDGNLIVGLPDIGAFEFICN